MINKTYIDKATTIVKDSEYNFGLNPICELNYGKIVSRALIYFDINKLKERVNDKTYANISKLKHILKLTNCGSIDVKAINKRIPSFDSNGEKERAASFDIILFTIPCSWDAGRGFDPAPDFWVNGKPSVSKQGCNWYQCYNGKEWDEYGVYSNTTLSHEYDNFSAGIESVVIARQHFDFGNENFEIDITDTVNKFISGELENNGIGIAFSPLLEESNVDMTQYIGFFNNNTNTYFEPYLETIYDEYVIDDRSKFYIGKKNRLYLYSYVDGKLENLDEIPTCSIDDKEYEVKQATKGIYYAEISLQIGEAEGNTIMYDKWSNLAYNGEKLEDVELEFVVLPYNKYFQVGMNSVSQKSVIPSLSGINDNENIIQGDERVVMVDFRQAYSQTDKLLLDNCEYRIFTKDGKREIDVIDYSPIEQHYLYNYFMIRSDEFVPQTYYVDIKVRIGNEIKIFKEKLRFNIVSNITNIKR